MNSQPVPPNEALAHEHDAHLTVHHQADPTWPSRSSDVTDQLPEIGTVLGNRWRIDAMIAIGSIAIVYRGSHIGFERRVAVKCLKRSGSEARASDLATLQAEAHSLSLLRSKHVPQIWDFETDPSCPYLAIEYIDGPTLAESIRRGPLESRKALRAAEHVVSALQAAEHHGILHRDVKPHNIVLGPDGVARLIDFSLAAQANSEQAPVLRTHAERWIGTVYYLAPERTFGRTIADHRADMYSLGATLYHAITGRPPFVGQQSRQVLLAHREDLPIPPIKLNPKLSMGISSLVMRLLDKNPDRRFETFHELIQVIQKLANDSD